MRDVDMCDPDLALEEARARGETWKGLADLVRAHKKWRRTGRLPGKLKAGETRLDGFGGVDA